MKRIVLVMIPVFMLGACTNSSNATQSKGEEYHSGGKVEMLKKEVLEVHDKTMEQMATMAKLRTRLKEEGKSAKDTAAYYNAYEDLKQAHEDMMDWMHNFKDPAEQDWTEQQKVEYLQGQKQKIEGLEEYIESSIEKAQKVLSQK